jgi:hypothetical protein
VKAQLSLIAIVLISSVGVTAGDDAATIVKGMRLARMVSVYLPPLPGEESLAMKVAEMLDEHLPDNPGRMRTFGGLDKLPIPLEITGWRFEVKSARAVPGGWRAIVWVTPYVRPAGVGKGAIVFDRHIEVYRLLRGRLHLEEDYADFNNRHDWQAVR